MITGYGHFAQLAESLQWDETTIDLATDIESWTKLDDIEHEQILGLIAGFCIAETSVATHLTSFRAAASNDDMMAEVFAAQARDEARHARFFDRVVSEVVGVPGKNLDERLEVLRERISTDLVELFEERLPAIAEQVADDHENLTSAVGLYHMILEGVVLTAGQHALLDALEKLSVPMPGMRKGMELVLRDERWHIGFGSGSSRAPTSSTTTSRRSSTRARKRPGPGETSSPPRTSRRSTSSTSAVSSPSGSSSGSRRCRDATSRVPLPLMERTRDPDHRIRAGHRRAGVQRREAHRPSGRRREPMGDIAVPRRGGLHRHRVRRPRLRDRAEPRGPQQRRPRYGHRHDGGHDRCRARRRGDRGTDTGRRSRQLPRPLRRRTGRDVRPRTGRGPDTPHRDRAHRRVRRVRRLGGLQGALRPTPCLAQRRALRADRQPQGRRRRPGRDRHGDGGRRGRRRPDRGDDSGYREQAR